MTHSFKPLGRPDRRPPTRRSLTAKPPPAQRRSSLPRPPLHLQREESVARSPLLELALARLPQSRAVNVSALSSTQLSTGNKGRSSLSSLDRQRECPGIDPALCRQQGQVFSLFLQLCTALSANVSVLASTQFSTGNKGRSSIYSCRCAQPCSSTCVPWGSIHMAGLASVRPKP